MATVDQAANHLLDRLKAPVGALMISVWYGNTVPIIKVSARPQYEFLLEHLPADVDGFKVERSAPLNISLT